MTIRNIAGLQYLLDYNPLFHRRDIHFWPDDDRINDLFTNILLLKEIAQALRRTPAPMVYIGNLGRELSL
ncbi:hypothetical protein ACT4US_32870, partial [Bacillus sp. HC-Mk]